MHNNNSTFLLSSLSCPVKLQKFCGPFFSAHERLSHSHYLYPRSFSTHLIIYPLQFSIQLVHVDTIILVVATLSAYTHSLHFFSLFFFFFFLCFLHHIHSLWTDLRSFCNTLKLLYVCTTRVPGRQYIFLGTNYMCGVRQLT